jgi:tetraacyldisaccharide 4'-kinase
MLIFKSVHSTSILLFPFAILYNAITQIRNFLYDKKIFKSYETPCLTINVGNLTVGGTGKTPHVEWLIRHFTNLETATLSRGYGRKTKGFLEAKENTTAENIGDEPLQFYQKFGRSIRVFVGENRAKAIQSILEKYKNTELIILDDAFQHRAIHANINILLTDYGRLFTNDFLLPSGLLREARSGAKRASAVIVSKCPTNLSSKEQLKIKEKIAKYTNAPVFFSYINYQSSIINYQFNTSYITHHTSFISLSAIAQPHIFEDYLKQHFELTDTIRYADHHHFTANDIQEIIQKANGTNIITTEKDFVKILPLLSVEQQAYFYYLPIEICFFDAGFEQWLKNTDGIKILNKV